jgi:hypothetical protein
MILSSVFQRGTSKEILHSISDFLMLKTAGEAFQFQKAIFQADSTTQ